SSTTLALALGDALAICCMKIRNTTIEDFARLHPLGQLGKNITLKVKDLMHTGEQIPKITMNSAFKDAIIEISNKMLGCVCIVSPENKLIGIITDGDVRRTLQSHDDYQNLKVKDIMTYNPITIKPDAFLGEALAIMENRSSEISMLPIVTENNELIGIIHIHDILRSGK
ncbi:MAG: arabinose-5-phosphate isomerase, partial [Bacteroidota bacterium]|nr:arabinose-5-phosphate isomerase [Bacteroidota bacterium]